MNDLATLEAAVRDATDDMLTPHRFYGAEEVAIVALANALRALKIAWHPEDQS